MDKNEQDRLNKQMRFIEEIDKEKLIGSRHIYQMLQGKKMMQSMHGIWLLWLYF